jgi:hypothetical protein
MRDGLNESDLWRGFESSTGTEYFKAAEGETEDEALKARVGVGT